MPHNGGWISYRDFYSLNLFKEVSGHVRLGVSVAVLLRI
jgi:hypothetical protein